MTICISARFIKQDGTVVTRVASDSEVSFGSKRLRGISMSAEKVVQFPGASIAASGSGCVFEALDILKSDPKYYSSVQFNTRADIRNFAIDLYSEVDSLIDQSKISREEVSIGAILVTTKDTVWAIFQDLSIFSFDEWFCTGSGADTATGLMTSYYKRWNTLQEEDLEWILTEVIKETCAIEQGCGEPVRIYSVLAPNPPVKVKTKKRKVLTETPSSDKLNQAEEGVSKSDKQSRPKRHRLP